MDKNILKITFFGDSITYGQGVSPQNNWVTLLSKDFEDIFELNVVTSNAGINGNTTRQALERMPYDVQNNGVDILFIQFGLNDSNYWQTDKGLPRVSPEAFEANLLEIISRGRTFGAKLIFLHTNHPVFKKLSYYDLDYPANNKLYNNIIRKIAYNDSDIILIDIEKEFETLIHNNKYTLEDLLLEDGVHLSLLGNEIYYHYLNSLIKPYIDSFLADRISLSK